MTTAIAWILQLDSARRVAVGERTLLHLVHEPVLWEVPLTPAHCRHVVLWQGKLLPVVDLAAWFGVPLPSNALRFVGIIGFQAPAFQGTQLGGLLMTAPPQRVTVDDAQARPIPEDGHWEPLALSCFSDQDGAVPILHLPRLFSGALQ